MPPLAAMILGEVAAILASPPVSRAWATDAAEAPSALAAAAARRPISGGAVRLDGIVKRFGGRAVLDGISLDIRAGEFVTILGPSGCGKSTLLRIIAGLEPQSAGAVLIDGLAVDALPPRERDVAMVFQSYALYPHLTAFDNIAVPLRMRRLAAWQRLPGARLLPGTRRADGEIAAAVRAVAVALRIEDLLPRKPGQLSGGQKQRVALARAMVRQPRAFLMDEPLSNLDAELRVHMRAELAQLHRELGATFIYVTHDQTEAMTMSDRVVLIDSGVPLQVASPSAIYRDPDDLRVARFVGTPRINVVPAVAREHGVDLLGLVLPIASGLAAGTPLQIGIRPECLSPADGGGLAGRVVHRENLGADLFLHVAVAGAAAPLVVRCGPTDGERLAPGDAMGLAVAARQVLLFDREGRRLRPPAGPGGRRG